MSKLIIIGEGKPTDKPLGELVGHVVTIDGFTALVAREAPGWSARLWIDGNSKDSVIRDSHRVPDLDHGALAVATDDAVCRPDARIVRDRSVDTWAVYCGDVLMGTYCMEESAVSLVDDLDSALSNLPTVADVERRTIEEVCDYIDARILVSSSRGFASTLVNVRDSIRRRFNLPAPPADHIPDAGKKGVAAIIGKWPGDETDEQVEAALNDLAPQAGKAEPEAKGMTAKEFIDRRKGNPAPKVVIDALRAASEAFGDDDEPAKPAEAEPAKPEAACVDCGKPSGSYSRCLPCSEQHRHSEETPAEAVTVEDLLDAMYRVAAAQHKLNVEATLFQVVAEARSIAAARKDGG